MEKCTRAMGYVILILVVTLFIAILPTDADLAVYDETIRLHILARSDSDEDQRVKLVIRDKLLEKYGEELKGIDGKADAERRAISMLNDITLDVNEWIRLEGGDYTADADIYTEWYDTREYESYTLPQGYYTSLVITLGGGEGKNWWCVMYPPLCLDMSTKKSQHYDKGVNDLIAGKYVVKFKMLELITDAFGGK